MTDGTQWIWKQTSRYGVSCYRCFTSFNSHNKPPKEKGPLVPMAQGHPPADGSWSQTLVDPEPCLPLRAPLKGEEGLGSVIKEGRILVCPIVALAWARASPMGGI